MRRFPIAYVNVHTPYFSGNVKALCMNNPVYDLIIGNVTGVQMPDGVNEGTASDVGTAETRRGVDMETQTETSQVNGEQNTEVITESDEPMTDSNTQASIGVSVETRCNHFSVL